MWGLHRTLQAGRWAREDSAEVSDLREASSAEICSSWPREEGQGGPTSGSLASLSKKLPRTSANQCKAKGRRRCSGCIYGSHGFTSNRADLFLHLLEKKIKFLFDPLHCHVEGAGPLPATQGRAPKDPELPSTLPADPVVRSPDPDFGPTGWST